MASPKHRVAMIVGSNRRDSINRKLAVALARLSEDKFDFIWPRIDDLPMYNQDLEGDRPASVRRFTAEIATAPGVLVVMPEHNRSLPAVLKSAIDWGSKPAEQNVWRDKVTAITGTSPGAIGAAVGQQHLRQILGILGAVVMGGEAYISFRPDLIDGDGNIAVESTRVFLRNYLDRFSALLGRLAAH